MARANHNLDKDRELVFALKLVGHYLNKKRSWGLASVCFRDASLIIKATPEHDWQKGLCARLGRLGETAFDKYRDGLPPHPAEEGRAKR